MTEKEIKINELRCEILDYLSDFCKTCDTEKQKLSNHPFDSLYCERCFCEAVIDLGYKKSQDLAEIVKGTVVENHYGDKKIFQSVKKINEL